MLEHQDKLNDSATAFIHAFSELIKDSTSHLATRDDIDTTNKNMQAQFARQEERMDSLSRDIGTTNKNMQAQFARQEEKIAEINQNMQARFAEQGKKITEINRKLD